MTKPLAAATVVLAITLASSAMAETLVASTGSPPQAAIVVKTARLKLMDASKEIRLLAGRLYRVPLVGDQGHVADVSERGELDQPYECTKGDRLLAVPVGTLFTGNSRTKPCSDAVEFEYQTTLTVALETVKPAPNLTFDHYLRAYQDLSNLYGNAAGTATGPAKVEYVSRARASEWAVFAATAMALGDENLDKLVMRDPSKGYRLALTDDGIATLRKLQRDNNLPITGKLDYATLKIVGAYKTPPGLTTAKGESFVLPREWVTDDVIKFAPNKSTGLVELGAASMKKSD